jgi:hypothetical protein
MRDELFAECLPEEYRRHEERRKKARVKAHKQFELLLHEQRNLGAEYDENRRGHWGVGEQQEKHQERGNGMMKNIEIGLNRKSSILR